MPMRFEFRGVAEDGGVAPRGGGPTPSEAVQFDDADGVRWIVREASPSHVAAHAGKTSLIFESAVAVRRVWDYPPSWRAMTPAQLSALSWKV